MSFCTKAISTLSCCNKLIFATDAPVDCAEALAPGIDALSALIHFDNAYAFGRRICEKLKELIPRQQFDIAVHAHPFSRRSEVRTALLYLLRPHAVGQISDVTLVPAPLPTVRAHEDIVPVSYTHLDVYKRQ